MWRWVNDITNVLLPPHCLVCKCPIAQQSELFCLSCYGNLPLSNHFKQKENDCYSRFVEDGFVLNYTASLFYFQDNSPLQSLIHLLKYKGKTDVGYYFGQQLGREVNNLDELTDIDIILPMPLHPQKEHIRGYNQSYWISKGISQITNLPICTETVKRIKPTKTQTRMNKAQRRENMNSAFQWEKAYPKYTHFMLVDDVVTTGASIQALISACPHWNTYKFSVICIGYTR